MEENRCIKEIFVRSLQKYKRCIKPLKHKGPHSADLMGETFGLFTVVRLHEPVPLGTRWVLSAQGKETVVIATKLINARYKGKYSGLYQIEYKRQPEYATVRGHHYMIFSSSRSGHRNYKGMPFHKAWNPDEGGSLQTGAIWVLENLGPKPGPEWSMDIIEHEKGFIPGNIRWAQKNTQARNKRHKILGRFTLDELEVEAKRHGYKLVKI